MPGHIKKSSGPDPGNICFYTLYTMHMISKGHVSLRLCNSYLLEYFCSVEKKI
jgi:hypothetical protein